MPLSQFLANFVTSAAVLNPRPDINQDHSRDFVLGTRVNEIPRVLGQALGFQVPAFPITVDWPGVTDRGGPTLTEHPRALFGSSYAERGVTSGARRFGIGFSEQTAQFKTIDGLSLRDGLDMFFEASDSTDPSRLGDLQPALERDVLQETLAIRLDRTVFNFVVSYGLSDRLDVGLTVPVVKVSVDGRITATVHRTATSANPEIHAFDLLELNHKTTYATRDVDGLGDMSLRAKMQLVGDQRDGFAVGLGLRMPTGAVEEFLGAGTSAARVSALWSGVSGSLGPHVNVSYSRPFGSVAEDFGVESAPAPTEVQVVGGTDVVLHRRWAVSGDVMFRRVDNVAEFVLEDTVFKSRGPGPLPSADFVARGNVVLASRAGTANQVYAIVSSKLLVGERLIFHGDFLAPLQRHGLAAGIGAVAGLGFGL